MHPIVMVAGDKDPAIGKAVDILQTAGFDVRVLNSATAKLVDFLGAIAGVDDEDSELPAPEDEKADKKAADEPATDEAPADDTPPAKDDAPVDDDDPLNPAKMEAMVNGEAVKVVIVEGNTITLYPSSISVGAKTFFSLNESQYSFWPAVLDGESIVEGVELSFNNAPIERLTKINIATTAMSPPTLKVGRDWLTAANLPPDVDAQLA